MSDERTCRQSHYSNTVITNQWSCDLLQRTVPVVPGACRSRICQRRSSTSAASSIISVNGWVCRQGRGTTRCVSASTPQNFTVVSPRLPFLFQSSLFTRSSPTVDLYSTPCPSLSPDCLASSHQSVLTLALKQQQQQQQTSLERPLACPATPSQPLTNTDTHARLLPSALATLRSSTI